MNKKVVFISVPMTGWEEKDILDNIEKAKAEYLKRRNLSIYEVAFVHNFGETSSYYNAQIGVLSKALAKMARCDEVFFGPGWGKSRGCRFELLCCMSYGMSYMLSDVND